jgi:hypothetical protein
VDFLLCYLGLSSKIVWEMPLVNPDWTVMALDKFLSHPDVFLFEDC